MEGRKMKKWKGEEMEEQSKKMEGRKMKKWKGEKMEEQKSARAENEKMKERKTRPDSCP